MRPKQEWRVGRAVKFRTSAAAVMLASGWLAASQPASGPATSTAPATGPATATAPAERLVEWHRQYDGAVREARSRKVPLLVVYFDPDAPAWEALQQRTLQDIQTRRFLARFAAVRLDATAGEGKKRFQATGAKETPLTQVLSPEGDLLDSIPGAIIPAEEFRERLACSLAYWKAVSAKPFDVAAQWQAVQARLKLSTRGQAAAAIDRLMKLPAGRLPQGVGPAHLHLAKGKALLSAAAKKAETHLRKARELAPKDPSAAGEALIAMIELALQASEYQKAHQYCAEYIKDFPSGPDIGSAYYYKALVEMTGLDDRAEAVNTLKQYLGKYGDDAGAVRARKLLQSLEKMRRK